MNQYYSLNELSFYLNKWRQKNPMNWTRLDTFCWMFDWFFTRDIAIENMDSFFVDLPNGYTVCLSSHEYFTYHSEQYGLRLFEDLHIFISSYHGSKQRSRSVRY